MTNENENTGLAVIEKNDYIVRPADLSVVAETMRMFEQAKSQVLRADDIQKITGKDFVKKSGWRRLARAFTLNTEIIKFKIDRADTGNIISAEFVVRASHPNGAYTEAWGGCDINERKFNKNQDIAATAQTRATNRAISDLIAGGEVSAEEMNDRHDYRSQPGNQATSAPAPKANPKLEAILFPGLDKFPPKNEKEFDIGIGTSGKLANKISGKFKGKLAAEFKEAGYASDKERHALMAKLYSAFRIPKESRHTSSNEKFTTGHGMFFMDCLAHENFARKADDEFPPWMTPDASEPVEGGTTSTEGADVDSGALDREPGGSGLDPALANGDVDLEEDPELYK